VSRSFWRRYSGGTMRTSRCRQMGIYGSDGRSRRFQAEPDYRLVETATFLDTAG
jgi:hypothetical protein